MYMYIYTRFIVRFGPIFCLVVLSHSKVAVVLQTTGTEQTIVALKDAGLDFREWACLLLYYGEQTNR